MPDQKNYQNSGGQSTGAPSTAEVKDKAKQVTGQAQDAAQQGLDQAKDHLSAAREGAMKGYRQAEGTIARNPTPSILIGFGVGFGLGVVICTLLTSKEETWAEKYLPDSLQNVPDQYQSLVSQLKGLPKTVQKQLPRSLSKYLS